MHNSCHCHHESHSCVRRVPMFNHLAIEQMDIIGQAAKPIVLKKGEVLFSEGDSDDSLYIVNTGRIKVYSLSKSGKDNLVRILETGDFLGEVAIFTDGGTHDHFAEALVDTSVCTISRADFKQFLEEYPEIAIKLLSLITTRLKESELQLSRITTEDVESRIISYIIDTHTKSDSSTVLNLPMNKKELSSFLGTSPETVSRRFKSLEDAGLIKQLGGRKIEVLDVNGLEERI